MASSTMSKLLDMDSEGLSYLDRYTVDECIKAGECTHGVPGGPGRPILANFCKASFSRYIEQLFSLGLKTAQSFSR